MKAHPSRNSPLSGFTLLELIISGGLMALILVSAYFCLSSAVSSRKLIEYRGDVVQNARVAMALLGADLRAACPLSKEMPFLGMQRQEGEIQADNLDFATHNYTPRRPGEGDFCAVSYFLARTEESGPYSLWRRRNPMLAIDPLSGGTREEIARALRGLKFEYYDGFDWYTQWGDPDGRGKALDSFREHPNLQGMPEAVRVTLWFETETRPASKSRSASKSTTDEAAGEPVLTFQTVCRLNLAGISLRNTASAPANSGDTASPRPTENAPQGGKQ